MSGVETMLTIEEFERLPESEGRTELVRGRLVREPFSNLLQGSLASRIAAVLMDFVERHGLGAGFIATGFVLCDDPPTVRAPHVAFVSANRLPPPEGQRGSVGWRRTWRS